jgi:hypothetical protein
MPTTFAGWVVTAMVHQGTIGPVAVTESSVTLENVSPRFVEALRTWNPGNSSLRPVFADEDEFSPEEYKRVRRLPPEGR